MGVNALNLSDTPPNLLMRLRTEPNWEPLKPYAENADSIAMSRRNIRVAESPETALAKAVHSDQQPEHLLSLLQAPTTDFEDGVVDDVVKTSQKRGSDRPKNGQGTDWSDSGRNSSNFENLFRISPVPLIQQDYSLMEKWMDGLRRQGVEDLREHLGDGIEAIRQIVPMIRIVAANPAGLRAVGLPLGELIGPINPKIVNAGSEPSWYNQIEAVWKGIPESRVTFTAEKAGGESYDAESIIAAPLVDEKPDYSQAVIAIIDVTHHRAEERRMLEIIETKNRFLATVSHEIRTPLTAIIGFGRLLEGDETLTGDDRELMTSSIVEHAQEIADLVDDLLVATRFDMDRIKVVEATINVIDEVRRTLQAGGSHTTNVEVNCQVESPAAIGDPARVRQILRNLLTNAERYGGPAVMITISARPGSISIAVADNGPGVPSSDSELIFEPFQRAHNNPGLTDSVGIGLSISRQLAERMGGSLRYSRRFELSVFELILSSVTKGSAT